MAMPELSDRLPCYRHGDRLTGARCTRCGRPICADCMISAPVGHQCPNCVKEGNRNVRPVRWAPASPGALTPVVKVLVGINVVVFLLTSANVAWVPQYAQIPFEVARGQLYRLITAAFLHANVAHIAFNMLALVIFGPLVEAAMGRVRFLTLYLLAALGGSVCSYFLGPINVIGVGASGAIFGVLGAWFVIAQARHADVRAILVLIGINLALSFSDPAIDWRAHVGGLLTGLVVGALFIGAEGRSPSQQRAIEIVTAVTTLVLLVALINVRTHQIRPLL